MAGDNIDTSDALKTLARHRPHDWASSAWHIRRCRRYVAELRRHLAGEQVDVHAIAKKLRRDVRLCDPVNSWRRYYRELAKLFEQAAVKPESLS